MDSTENRPMRRSSEQSVANRAALDAVRPLLKRIGDWQAAAVYLKARYQREHDRDGRLQLAAEGQELLQRVRASSEQLAGQSNELPPSVVNHARYQDALRAIHSVASTLETFVFARQ